MIFLVLEVKRSKILQKLNKRDCFCLHSWFHFCDISQTKSDLQNKYIYDSTLCLANFLSEIIN